MVSPFDNKYSELQAEGIEACEKRRYAKAEIAFAEALKLIQDELTHSAVPISNELKEKLAQSLNNLAAIFQIQGKYSMSLEHYLKSADIYKELQGESSLVYATSLHNLAIIYGAKREYEKAEKLFREALATKEKLLGEGHPELETIMKNLATLLKNSGKLKTAE